MLYAYTIENVLSIITVHDDLSAHRRSDRPRLEEEFAVRCSDPTASTWTMMVTIYARWKTINENDSVMVNILLQTYYNIVAGYSLKSAGLWYCGQLSPIVCK